MGKKRKQNPKPPELLDEEFFGREDLRESLKEAAEAFQLPDWLQEIKAEQDAKYEKERQAGLIGTHDSPGGGGLLGRRDLH